MYFIKENKINITKSYLCTTCTNTVDQYIKYDFQIFKELIYVYFYSNTCL